MENIFYFLQNNSLQVPCIKMTLTSIISTNVRIIDLSVDEFSHNPCTIQHPV